MVVPAKLEASEPRISAVAMRAFMPWLLVWLILNVRPGTRGRCRLAPRADVIARRDRVRVRGIARRGVLDDHDLRLPGSHANADADGICDLIAFDSARTKELVDSAVVC